MGTNPYRDWMTRLERVPSGYQDGPESCSEAGMNKLAEHVVLFDEQIGVLTEYLHVKGGQLCPDGVPLAFHEWAVNDYYDPPLFDLSAWHGDRYCIAVGYEMHGMGGHFFPWDEGVAVLRERRLQGRG